MSCEVIASQILHIFYFFQQKLAYRKQKLAQRKLFKLIKWVKSWKFGSNFLSWISIFTSIRVCFSNFGHKIHACLFAKVYKGVHCKCFDHKSYGDWKLRGPWRDNLHYLWKRAVRIAGKPRDNYKSTRIVYSSDVCVNVARGKSKMQRSLLLIYLYLSLSFFHLITTYLIVSNFSWSSSIPTISLKGHTLNGIDGSGMKVHVH